VTEIRYYRTPNGREPVREYITGLPLTDQAAIIGDLELIEATDILHANVVTRKLSGYRGLWEIKTGTRHQQRIFYCALNGPALVLLHACKKQHQSQPHDVELAARRMKEVA
jgi:phage-related protein